MTPEQQSRLENLVFSPLDPFLSLDTRLRWFLDLVGEIERAAVEAERERIKAHFDTATLRYTGGDYARGWNDALAATLVHIFAQQNGSTE